jgi:hypothetical protein
VNCAREIARAARKFPFGAAHRVYFDTPSLKGWRSLPRGSEREHVENVAVTKTALAIGIGRSGVLPTETGDIK